MTNPAIAILSMLKALPDDHTDPVANTEIRAAFAALDLGAPDIAMLLASVDYLLSQPVTDDDVGLMKMRIDALVDAGLTIRLADWMMVFGSVIAARNVHIMLAAGEIDQQGFVG
jgi:hypothetical protein